jgi:hypothetical protein
VEKSETCRKRQKSFDKIEETYFNRSADALGAYFKPNADKPGIEARIGLLTRALGGLDFAELRSRYPDLRGGGSQPVVLFEDPEGVPRLRLRDWPVDTAGAAGRRPKEV